MSTIQAMLEPVLAPLLDKIPRLSTAQFVLTVLALCIPPVLALICYEQESKKLRAKEPEGCRKLGLNVSSNLSNEYDRRFAEGFPPPEGESSEEWWRIKSLWVYPIKSCKGVELGRTTCLSTGMEFDRQFTFAQLKPVKSENTPKTEQPSHEWEFITQRQYPRLATVKTEIWAPDQSVQTYIAHQKEAESGGVIIVSFPYHPPGLKSQVAKLGARLLGTTTEKSFAIPFNPTAAQIEQGGYTHEKMKIWNEKVTALNMEAELPTEFREYLGMSHKLGLFRIDNEKLREVYRNAPKAGELGYQPVVGFQDSYPLHLINLASVRDLEKQIPRAPGAPRLSARAFRANVIVTGPPAYDEEEWKKLKIGWYSFHVAARTPRCKMPNIDQDSGEKSIDNEPDRTLRSFRNVDPGMGPNVGAFGMLLVPCDETSQFKVGDEIRIEERGEHVNVPMEW